MLVHFLFIEFGLAYIAIMNGPYWMDLFVMFLQLTVYYKHVAVNIWALHDSFTTPLQVLHNIVQRQVHLTALVDA